MSEQLVRTTTLQFFEDALERAALRGYGSDLPACRSCDIDDPADGRRTSVARHAPDREAAVTRIGTARRHGPHTWKLRQARLHVGGTCIEGDAHHVTRDEVGQRLVFLEGGMVPTWLPAI